MLPYPFESRSTDFRRPMIYNPKWAPNVYRLMMMIPSYFMIKILVKYRVYYTVGSKGIS